MEISWQYWIPIAKTKDLLSIILILFEHYFNLILFFLK